MRRPAPPATASAGIVDLGRQRSRAARTLAARGSLHVGHRLGVEAAVHEPQRVDVGVVGRQRRSRRPPRRRRAASEPDRVDVGADDRQRPGRRDQPARQRPVGVGQMTGPPRRACAAATSSSAVAGGRHARRRSPGCPWSGPRCTETMPRVAPGDDHEADDAPETRATRRVPAPRRGGRRGCSPTRHRRRWPPAVSRAVSPWKPTGPARSRAMHPREATSAPRARLRVSVQHRHEGDGDRHRRGRHRQGSPASIAPRPAGRNQVQRRAVAPNDAATATSAALQKASALVKPVGWAWLSRAAASAPPRHRGPERDGARPAGRTKTLGTFRRRSATDMEGVNRAITASPPPIVRTGWAPVIAQ